MQQPNIPPFDAIGEAVAVLVAGAAILVAVGYLINWAADFFTSQKETVDQWEK